MLQFLIGFLMFTGAPASAGDAKIQSRIEELEKSVQVLQQKVEKMESTLMKGGGFMITTNASCEIETPFNGTFSATELSEKAARRSVIEQCKEKLSDHNQCGEISVKCKK